MAMLAEPRRKQRIGPNPRGKFFTEDDDNRGRQMLMKMGWKTGDGLGATSQGMSEPLKPKVHTDSRGLGYDRKKDPWVAHNEEFEQLLKNLNTSSTTEGIIFSKPASGDEDSSNSANEGLEKKSKGSRSRIHYHKFVKNKDLSRASTKDISCIFGKALDETADVYSLLNANTDNIEKEADYLEVHEPEMCDTEENPVKKKKKKVKAHNIDCNNEDVPLQESVDSLPATNSTNQSEASEPCEIDGVPEKRKKKKSKKHRPICDEDAPSEEVSAVSLSNENSTDQPEVCEPDQCKTDETATKRKKKKSKKRELGHTQDATLDDANAPLLISDPRDQPNVCASEPVISETEDGCVKKKKKKSKKRDEDDTAEAENVSLSLGSEGDNIETCETDKSSRKKKKSKKRKTSCNEDTPLEEVTTPVNECSDEIDICKAEECNIEETGVKRKKKKRKHEQVEECTKPEISSESTPPPENTSDVSTQNGGDKVEKFGSLQFINRGSIVDYFRSKMLTRNLSSSVKM